MREFAIRTFLSSLVLVGCVAAEPMPHQDVSAVGRVVSVQAEPACGIFWFGSGVTYEIMAGPKGMVGKHETAMVSCIEIELAGDPHKYDVGQVHRLSLTKRRIYNFGILSSPPSDWYYLISASDVR